MQISCRPGTADARPSSMRKSRKGEKQRQYYGSHQPCDKDGAAQGSAENDLAASGLLGRIRRCRLLLVPFGHRWIGSFSMHLGISTNARRSRALWAKPKQDERFRDARLKMSPTGAPAEPVMVPGRFSGGSSK